MKNVLVLMHDDAGQEARFQAALDLTRALGGHLTCLDVSILPVVMGDYAVLGGEALLLAGEEAREGDNRTRMEARLTHEDVAFDWIDVTGDLSHSLRDAAVMSDIIVLNRALGSTHYPDMAHVVGDVVTVSDKPVLAVPEEARALDVFGHAVIAWNGSPTSVAALRAALPLLTHASKVTILEVDDGSLKLPATDAAEYLSRHGIIPIVTRADAHTDSAATILLSELRNCGADYLVMGGFGHRRMAEAIFGGVTRTMLNACPVPIFLTH